MGGALALMEVSVVLIELLQRFSFVVPEEQRDVDGRTDKSRVGWFSWWSFEGGCVQLEGRARRAG